MGTRVQRFLARACGSPYLDELIGDLEELRVRRARARGPRHATLRYWLDVASVIVFQSRLRRWGPRNWSAAGALAAVSMAAIGGVGAYPGPDVPYTITATDAAGVFTLDLLRGRVVAATVDGHPLPAERIVQRDDVLILKGAGTAGDLEIEVTGTGGIRWEGREPGGGEGPQDTPIELAWARAYFAEVDSVSAADGGALWGTSLAGPFLFVDRASRYVVANMPDAAGVLTRRDGVWTGTLPDDVGIANTAIEWAGRRWTMVIWPVASNGYDRRRLLLHETFHRLQPALGFAMGNPSNAHLASRDGRILMRLEWRALAEALIRDSVARRTAVADALAFRARRHALFPDGAAEERTLELNEGLAEYTGLRLSGLPPTARAVTAARDLMRRERSENITRSFAYGSGPALGVLLDAADPSWRSRVTDGAPLGELLRQAYDLPATDGDDYMRRIAPYDGQRLITEETRMAERAAAEQARMRQAFVEGPTLTLPVGDAFGYSFDPNRVVPLDGHGSVYLVAEVRDAWGTLTVESGGVLMRRPDRLITGVVVPAPMTDTAPLAGDGWRLELADGWTVRPGTHPADWVVVPAN